MTYTQITNEIKQYFEGLLLVARVENEDLDGFDLDKSTVYPLVLFYVQNAPLGERTRAYSVQVLVMDILNVNKESGEDNRDFIFNETLEILNSFVIQAKRGELFSELVQIDDDVVAEPFTDRFDNGLAGWGTTLTITVKNDMTIC